MEPTGLEDAQYMEQESKDCVNGYVRNIEKLFANDMDNMYFTSPA